MAGCIAGYLSHVPHAVSTLRLLKPHLSYSEICRYIAAHVHIHACMHAFEAIVRAFALSSSLLPSLPTCTLFTHILLVLCTHIAALCDCHA